VRPVSSASPGQQADGSKSPPAPSILQEIAGFSKHLVNPWIGHSRGPPSCFGVWNAQRPRQQRFEAPRPAAARQEFARGAPAAGQPNGQRIRVLPVSNDWRIKEGRLAVRSPLSLPSVAKAPVAPSVRFSIRQISSQRIAIVRRTFHRAGPVQDADAVAGRSNRRKSSLPPRVNQL